MGSMLLKVATDQDSLCQKSVNSAQHAIISFVICKCGSIGNMFLLMDGKEHRLLKERMTAKGDEGGTGVGHWIKGSGEQKSL